jgi:hypothetical protein
VHKDGDIESGEQTPDIGIGAAVINDDNMRNNGAALCSDPIKGLPVVIDRQSAPEETIRQRKPLRHALSVLSFYHL